MTATAYIYYDPINRVRRDYIMNPDMTGYMAINPVRKGWTYVIDNGSDQPIWPGNWFDNPKKAEEHVRYMWEPVTIVEQYPPLNILSRMFENEAKSYLNEKRVIGWLTKRADGMEEMLEHPLSPAFKFGAMQMPYEETALKQKFIKRIRKVVATLTEYSKPREYQNGIRVK